MLEKKFFKKSDFEKSAKNREVTVPKPLLKKKKKKYLHEVDHQIRADDSLNDFFDFPLLRVDRLISKNKGLFLYYIYNQWMVAA